MLSHHAPGVRRVARCRARGVKTPRRREGRRRCDESAQHAHRRTRALVRRRSSPPTRMRKCSRRHARTRSRGHTCTRRRSDKAPGISGHRQLRTDSRTCRTRRHTMCRCRPSGPSLLRTLQPPRVWSGCSLTGGSLRRNGETLLNASHILGHFAAKSQGRRSDRAYWPGVWPKAWRKTRVR
jgi:hypothetical protein